MPPIAAAPIEVPRLAPAAESICPDEDEGDDWKNEEKDRGHGPPFLPPGQAKKRR